MSAYQSSTDAARGDLSWPSIPALAADAGARFGAAEAIVDGSRRVSFAELVADSRRVTAALIAWGIERGERVAVWAPNRYEWVVAALGAQGAGAALVPVNTRFKSKEVSHILDRSGARVAFTVGEFLGMDYAATLSELRPQLPSLELIVGLDASPHVDHSLASFVELGERIGDADLDARIRATRPDDVSDVLFTSGTTGAPKGVRMTHAQTLRQFSDWCDMSGLAAGDRYVVVNPFFHMFGYKAGWLASLMRGAAILPKAVFDVEDVLRTIPAESVTVLAGPPTLFQSVLDHPDRKRFDLSSLRIAVTGAADIPVELIRRMREELGFSTIATGYGLTEAGTVTGGTWPEDDFETIATTAGRPRPGVEIRIADDEGVARPAGEAGEVLVRAYSVMRGYLDDPAETARAIDADGWLHTGDLGVFDERGCLRIVGRKKDMFIVGGFNAYPAEIENLLLEHPAVGRVAVVGMPDERLGEVGMAFVVAAPGADLRPEGLIAWARGAMANYKVPRAVELVAELPVNAAGKVEKEILRARAARAKR
jgi:acyl-CoA synthetase (AMP-forming)/AMP-acid ligase II